MVRAPGARALGCTERGQPEHHGSSLVSQLMVGRGEMTSSVTYQRSKQIFLEVHFLLNLLFVSLKSG